MVHEVTDETFEEEVLGSELPCLMDFYAPWCAPCEDMAPRLEELSERYEGRVRFCRADSDANKKLRIRFAVAALPYLVLVHGGQQTPLFDSAVPAERVAERLGALLAGEEAPTTRPLRW